MSGLNLTGIEWVLNPDGTQGYTWNPITGCLNHTPEGLCLGGMFPCYAYKLANGRLKQRYLANLNIAPVSYPLPDIPASLQPFYPRFWKDRLYEPIWLPSSHRPPAPKGIFPCDMSDLFGIGIPEEWTRRVMDIIRTTPYNRYYLLTKQPQNLIKFSPFPDNCWVGVTATNHTMLIEARHYLGEIEATTKFVSLEPLLEWHTHKDLDWLVEVLQSINWVIIGAQTKPYKPPKIEWVGEIVRARDKAGGKVFLKDNLYPLLGLGNSKSVCHNNEVGTLRQEMPK